MEYKDIIKQFDGLRYGTNESDVIIKNIIKGAIEHKENLNKLMDDYQYSRPETPEIRPRREPKNK